MTVEKKPAIYAAMSAVMKDISVIAKDSTNTQQGWAFRGIDAAYNALHPLLSKHKIFTIPRVLEGMRREERQSRSGGTLFYTIIKVEYDFISGDDGSKITAGPVMGEAMDSGDKSCNKCLSIAHKYVLLQTFLIPTEQTDDPDTQAYEVGPEIPPISTPDTPPPVVPQSVPEPPPIPTDETVVIQDESGAQGVADMIIGLLQKMYTGDVNGLIQFWNRNKKVIDVLDTDYPAQYERVKTAFTETRIQIEGAAK